MEAQSQSLKTAHRCQLLLTVLVGLTSYGLQRFGVIGGRTAILGLVGVETVMLALSAALTAARVRAIRRAARESGSGWFERLCEDEPAVRFAVGELRAIAAVGELLRGRRHGTDSGRRGFGYVRGTLSMPAAFLVLVLVEGVAVHLLIPWSWLRVVLLVLTGYSVLLVVGYFASRIVNPHLVDAETVTLRWGRDVVAVVPVSGVRSVREFVDPRRTAPAIEGDTLVLASLESANVRIVLADPVAVRLPVWGAGPKCATVSDVALYVSDPRGFVEASAGEAAVVGRVRHDHEHG